MGISASKEAQARDAEEEEKRQEHALERQHQQRYAEVKADYRRRLLDWRGDDTTSVDGKRKAAAHASTA